MYEEEENMERQGERRGLTLPSSKRMKKGPMRLHLGWRMERFGILIIIQRVESLEGEKRRKTRRKDKKGFWM